MIEAPSSSIPDQTQKWGATKAAYRLFNCPDVTRAAVMQPHFDKTWSECCSCGSPTVLLIQDTTELDFTMKNAVKGLGPIGNNKGTGMLVHSLLAVDPRSEGAPLGLLNQLSWVRPTGITHRGNETRAQRQKRPNKESRVWSDVLLPTKAIPPGLRLIAVGDRGSDCFDYWRATRAQGVHCLSRIFTNRRTGDREDKLFDMARRLPSAGTICHSMRARPGKPAHELILNIAWIQTTVSAPRNRSGKYPNGIDPLPITLVRCWSEEHKIEWVLLCTWMIDSIEDAIEAVRYYEHRWKIEEFHKALKTGCSMERSQLKDAHGIDVLLGFLSVIAMHIYALRERAKATPEAPAEDHVDLDFLDTLCSVRKLSKAGLTVKQYYREVALVGGFLGRRRDGDPGWQTLWRGMNRLETWVVGFRAAKNVGKDKFFRTRRMSVGSGARG